MFGCSCRASRASHASRAHFAHGTRRSVSASNITTIIALLENHSATSRASSSDWRLFVPVKPL